MSMLQSPNTGHIGPPYRGQSETLAQARDASPRKVSNVEQEMQKLSVGLDHLAEMIRGIRQKLEPVCQNAPTTASANGCSPPRPPMSGMANELATRNDQIQDLAALLHDLSNRIDL